MPLNKAGVEEFNKKKMQYNAAMENIQKTYNFMGIQEVERRQQSVQRPFAVVMLGQQRCLLVDSRDDTCYLLWKDQHGMICGSIVLRGYYLYETDPNWMAEWDAITSEGNAYNAITTYEKYL